MKSLRLLAVLSVACPTLLSAQTAQTALTIYNQNFAVVRDKVPLDLKAGENTVSFTGVTAQLEPDSVVLRDPSGKVPLTILDQSYRADTLSQGYLLSLNEGKTLDFVMHDKDGKEYTVKGKVIRSNFMPGTPNMPGINGSYSNSPIIEVDGQLRFSLPGEPVFPSLGDDTILKPALGWRIGVDQAVKLDADLSYVTNGINWQAAYNVVAPEKGNTIDIVGWVTINNQTGKTFDAASIKLVAGNVNKIQPTTLRAVAGRGGAGGGGGSFSAAAPVVTEQAFDEYHLYTLTRPETIHDRETKQVEFIQATGVKADLIYVYDGANVGDFRSQNQSAVFSDQNYGNQSNKKVWVMREFKNTKENGLGMALPKGRMRFYRADDADNSIQFVGENTIDHTPDGELVRLYTGDSFDLVGERTRTDFSNTAYTADETFQIKVRNHKAEPAEIRVVEHLYRGANWEITQKSADFTKTDSQTIEFRVPLKPDEEQTITYHVHYTR